MTGLLVDARAAALGTSGKPALRRALLDVDLGDAQFVDIGAVVVLGVGDRGLKNFLDDLGALLGAECQNVERLVDRQTANLVGDEEKKKAPVKPVKTAAKQAKK